MSTLSELIPSGGTQNNIEFVAQGTLANGQAVALRSDGKVEAISETSASNGTAVQFSTGNYAEEILSFPIPSTNQIVVAYQEAGIDNSFKAVVGTITANAIVFSSSPIAVSGGVAVTWIAGCFETGESKVVFAWTNNSNKLVALGGSVSGTGSSATISLGSASTISTSQISNNVFLQDNPAASGKTQFIYRDQSASSAKVLTLSINSSNTIGTGQATTITSTSYPRGVGPATEDDKSILVDSPNGGNLVLYVGSYNSGNDTWSFNTSSPVALNSGDTFFYNNPVVVANNFIGVAFTNASGYPTVNSFTLSGTTLTAGTPLVLASNGVGRNGFAYDATASKYVFAYRNTSTAAGLYHTIDFSGTAFTTASSGIQFVASTVDVSVAYNASQGKTIFSFSDGGDSEKGKGQVYTLPVSTASDFIGITNAAISSGATGEVAVKGGLSTGGNLIPEGSISFGSISSPASQGLFNSRMTYDSASNRIVLAYEDATNSNYGTAVVGTVSGTSVTWGTPVVFNSASTADGSIDVVYDPDSNKSIIAYRDKGNSGYGTAIVGTVSGTAISFGAESVFSTKNSYNINMTYDTSQDKVLIVYLDGGDSYKGYMIVGTVNGGASTISFGSEVQFESGTVGGSALSVCYDASATKSLLVYRVGTADYAASITISGTTPSIGTKNNWANVGYRNTQSVYVASSSACVIVYNNASGNLPVSSNIVAINSGSGNVTVNSSNSAISSTSLNERALVYDTSSANLIYVYNSYPSGSNVLSSILGKISGTSITWSDTTVVNSTSYSGNAPFPSMAYDSTNNKSVIAWRAAADSQSLVATTTATTPLVIGSTYYVQDDGTLGTGSTSIVAGEALSATSINLVNT